MANKKKMASRMRCSVVVLGDSRAGKSALIRRFTEGRFTQVGMKDGRRIFRYECFSAL